MADPQLQLALGDRARGQQANLSAAVTGHRDHRTTVEIAVALLARNGRAFCADDVHKLVRHELGDAPYDHNVVSSVMGTWARDGRIHRDHAAGLTPSRHRTRKGSRNSWWRGTGAQHAATA